MSLLAIPYAKHPTRGNISPDDKQDGKGRKANVICLGCAEPLIHRRRSKDGRRRAHYAHEAASQADVAKCIESAVHAKIKDMIATLSGTLRLPEWHGWPITFTPIRGTTEAPVPTPRMTSREADVLFSNSMGQSLAVEVWYEHRKEPEVIDDYRHAQLPALELRVTGDDHNISVAELRSILRTRSKWIVEP